MRDTSADFPSSTLSSKDSGVSTLSNKKSKNHENLTESTELRGRSGPVAPRPITIAAGSFSGVTSAPNLLSPAVLNQLTVPNATGSKIVSVKTNKPRMPDPEPEPQGDPQEDLHVNRIHVSSPPTPSVTNSVYMNVPKHPEYVNFSDSKHQYVNVPDSTQTSNIKRKLLVSDLVTGSNSTKSNCGCLCV